MGLSQGSPSARGAGLFANQRIPHYITGAYYLPIGYTVNGGGAAITANQVNYVPLTIWEPHIFQGASMYNTGTGDNGKKLRVMIFRDDAVSGGPGTLEKDFGEITLTGAAALRTLSSSWAAVPGNYWLATWADTSSTISVMAPHSINSAVGFSFGPEPGHFIGSFSADDNANARIYHHYVSATYGAAPATAVTPTSTYRQTVIAPSTAIGPPTAWLKA